MIQNGIDPFVSWSTFSCQTLDIPRGLFYGGIFFTKQEFKLPIHVSYISGGTTTLLGLWGLEDADNQEVGTIQFMYNKPNIGIITSPAGEYGGCLKGRMYNANNNPVWSGASVDNLPEQRSAELLRVSDLVTFLYNTKGMHNLDVDSLILDTCNCVQTSDPQASDAQNIVLTIPSDGVLTTDSGGVYYIAPNSSSGGFVGGTPLQRLTISGSYMSGGTLTSGGCAVLTDRDVIITPWSRQNTSGSYIEDVLVTNINGGVVIGTHKALSDYGA